MALPGLVIELLHSRILLAIPAAPFARSWPVGLPELDSLSMAMLLLSMAPAALLVWASIGGYRAPDCFMLVIFMGLSALAMMAVTNIVFFYFAWEILGLCCWGLGRWGTALAGRPGLPANISVALGSLLMFASLALIGWDSRSLEMGSLFTDHSAIAQWLLLAACFLRTWGILGQTWRPIEGRSFAISQGVLATGGAVAVGIYPLARLYNGGVAWSAPWEPAAMNVGAAVGAGAGALAGHPGTGAVVGGLAGGVGGYYWDDIRGWVKKD